LSQGRLAFEQRLGFRVPLPIRLRRLYRAHAIGGYLGVIATLTAALLSVPLFVTWTAGASLGVLVLLGILGLAPASEIAVSLVNRLVTFLVSPRLHTKLELSQGVPAEFRTVVVVPTFLTSQADIEEQVERLEVHYLANSEGHLHFALLSDWTDASHEHMPGDDELLATLIDSIARLNEKYEGPYGGGKRFLLLHRRRIWNEGEGKWIGWERKRGKLHELNRLLRGATDTTFMSIDGQPPTVPQGVRYVITLDADTRLPKGAAYRLIGSIAHPFNRPRFDPQKGRVVDGYGILQPRITPSLPTGPRSTTYQRIVSGPGGVDPYAAAISDVYQDLFEGGSYTGKGIYDVDVFEAALKDKVPENALLSHDLFEGVFARAGLLTDVDLFEEFPANYEVAARRRHRWVRGDWQLLPWILGHARDAAGREQRVHIPTESQWKMVDNLRRSLVAPLSLFVLACAWTLPAVPPLLWAGLIIGSVAVPAFIPVLDNLTPRRARISKRSHLRAVVRDISVASSQTFLGITMLADQAWLMTDAIVRTLGRLYLTRRNLLEWMTAAQADYGADLTPRAFYRDLRWGVVVALGAGSLCAVLKPGAWLVAMPFTLLWVMAPAVAWRISSPSEVTTTQALSTRDMRSLRLIARRTWRFFETFVDQEEHALPLDNFQEDPEPARAHRTSPTNFGWIGAVETAERLEATLQTMDKMRRIRGHFCNWYDTRDLRPLEPIWPGT
jgi:cyclic beta-1,2-glucan synthetase